MLNLLSEWSFWIRPASERSLTFGAEQLLVQHRGLLDLLQALASARGDW